MIRALRLPTHPAPGSLYEHHRCGQVVCVSKKFEIGADLP